MIFQKSFTEDARLFSKLTSIILISWSSTFLLSLGLGILNLGHLPVYGIDKDPSSINSNLFDAIRLINYISLLFSYFSFIAWPLLMIHLLINRVRFNAGNRWLHLSALASIFLFFSFKYIWTDQFLWWND